MTRLLFQTFLILCLFSPHVYAQTEKGQYCKDLKGAPVQIDVQLELPKPVYDLHQSLKDINQDRSSIDDWLKRSGMQKVWRSQEMAKLGYAEGGMAMVSGVQMMARHYDRYGVYYCPYVTKVDLAMMFRTRIVIPKNFKNGGCRFNLIHEHELRHYQVNHDTAKKFVDRLNNDLSVIVSEIENRQPYVPKGEVPAAFERMKTEIKSAVEVYVLQSMREEMARQNMLIDTPEEYASSGPKLKACKD